MLLFRKIFLICKDMINICKTQPSLYKKGLPAILTSLVVGLLFFIFEFIVNYDFNTKQIISRGRRLSSRLYYNPSDYFIWTLTSFLIIGIFVALEKVYNEYKKI